MATDNTQYLCPVCFKELAENLAKLPICASCDLYFHKSCGMVSADPKSEVELESSAGAPAMKIPQTFRRINNRTPESERGPICNSCSAGQDIVLRVEELEGSCNELRADADQLEDEFDEFQRRRIKGESLGSPKAASIVYAIFLGLLVVITGVLIWLGWASKPNVSIEYNMGEIIGGLLTGAGALAAGIAYTLKSLGILKKQ